MTEEGTHDTKEHSHSKAKNNNMSQIGIKINGLDKLTSVARRYPAIAQKHLDRAIVRSIGQIDRETKPLTPVKTGRLRNSMVPIFTPFRGVYGSPVKYASDVHDLYPVGENYKNPSLNKNAVAGFLAVGVKQAGGRINEAFAEALKAIVNDLAK